MAHAVFQTAQIMPINTQIVAKNPLLPKPFSPGIALKLRKIKNGSGSLIVRDSLPSSTVVDGGGDSVAYLERCFVSSSVASSSMVAPTMKKNLSPSVILEKSKTLDLSQSKKTRPSPEV